MLTLLNTLLKVSSYHLITAAGCTNMKTSGEILSRNAQKIKVILKTFLFHIVAFGAASTLCTSSVRLQTV